MNQGFENGHKILGFASSMLGSEKIFSQMLGLDGDESHGRNL